MSFAAQFQARFDNVISPAISGIIIDNSPLQPYRVDLSKTGDSVLTDIMDGIAHSRFVLADVSTVGRDSVTGEGFRNSNVLYEVGIALACRQPHDVLLVRSDQDRFLFDVSTIPHMTLDFTDANTAKAKLQTELSARLRQQQFVNDARIQIALTGLSNEEISQLEYIADLAPGRCFGRKDISNVDFLGMIAIPRLLDKQLIRVVGQFEKGQGAYEPTPLGRIVALLVKSQLRQFKMDTQETINNATPTERAPTP